jgi:hypothetical protein
MSEKVRFDIDLPLNARALEALQDALSAKQRRFQPWHKGKNVVFSILLLGSVFALATYGPFLAACIFCVALVFEAGLRGALSVAEYRSSHSLKTLLEAIPVEELARHRLRLARSPKALQYLQTVSAQHRSVLRFEFRGLLARLSYEQQQANEQATRNSLSELGVVLP